jgi:hypothetical protein
MPQDAPSDDPNREQRQNPRVDLFQPITCEGGGTVVESQVADLSVGGMFVDMSRTPFAAGTFVVVRFALRAGEPILVLDGEVSYVQERIGTGLRFVGLVGDDHDRISAYVDEAVGRKGQGRPPLRKSARVFIQVPVRVKGARTNGRAFDEATRIVTLSKHGACLVSTYNLEVGMKLRLETTSGREFLSNVVWVGGDASKSSGQVGVQCRGLAQSLGFQFP